MSLANNAPVTLVVGSDSLMGKLYQAHMERAGKPVLGTTRRREYLDDSHVYLDLADNLGNWTCGRHVEVAVLCAGITKFAICKADPVATARVNVEGMFALAANLVKSGSRILYLSTAVVFDGLKSHRDADDPICPTTEYGRQNAQAERRIQALGDSVTVLRLTKTLDSTIPLLKGWVSELQRGKPIHPYSDLVMAPIPVAFTMEVIDHLTQPGVSGIFQASGNRDVTYAEAALCCATTLGVDPTLVQPIDVTQEDLYTEPIPKHTTLNSSRLKSVYGLEPPDVCETLQDIFLELGTATVTDRTGIENQRVQ